MFINIRFNNYYTHFWQVTIDDKEGKILKLVGIFKTLTEARQLKRHLLGIK